ncbi:MAG TPA: response regulator [Acidimicrobiia bacterium]|nr:response regulator [Acidimicrobiia bacterium]
MGAQRVLIVDDDPDYRFLVRLALSPGGRFEVVGEAGDGPGAVAEAGRTHPDLVLLDCTLPGDAFDTLPGLRVAAPGARIVLVSGHGAGDLRAASRSAGAVGYLTKDTPARRLADELDALVGLVEAVEQVLGEASRRFDPDARSARAARRFVSEALSAFGDDDLTDTITLLVSELVTNAVIHAGSGVEVLVRLTGTAARVEVTDASAAGPAPRDATAEEDSGRGLALVESLARRWGVRPTAGGGKTVWFEVDR